MSSADGSILCCCCCFTAACCCLLAWPCDVHGSRRVLPGTADLMRSSVLLVQAHTSASFFW